LRIRCERCATTYELDEKRLPPHGALVKCTRCGHVFRAGPTVAGPSPAAAPAPAEPPQPGAARPPGEERTAIFGYAATVQDEQTARIPPPPPAAPARPGSSRPGEARGSGPSAHPRPAQGASVARRGKGSRWTWWLLAALLLAAAVGIGWWVVQSRVATPTTRLPAGAVLLPT
jgi:predicted Zn finger-like uncharacterized protein